MRFLRMLLVISLLSLGQVVSADPATTDKDETSAQPAAPDKPKASAVPAKKNDASTKASPEKGAPDSAYTKAVFQIIAATQTSMDESFGPIESALADELNQASKKLLADENVFKALVASAKARHQADAKETEEVVEVNYPAYAKLAMGSLQTALRQTPGVMSRQELINRARLVAEIAKFYGKKDPSQCRYLPHDFSMMLNVDAPWVEQIGQNIFEAALDDERKAIERIFSGTLPIVITDADVQSLFSKFAGEWIASLDDRTRGEIAMARTKGNYCVLWQHLLTDSAKMAESFPSAANKVLLPVLTMPTRGWLDVGTWGFNPAD